MIETCTEAKSADLFRVCNRGEWTAKPTRIRFLFAGIRFYTVTLPACVFDAPFTHVSECDSELPPPPLEFPGGIEVTRIYSCPLPCRVPVVTRLPRAIRYVAAQYRHFYIDLAGSFDQYLGKFSSKSRSTLKRKLHRFLRNTGTAEPLREYCRPAEMAEFHRLALAVSVKTYQHKLLEAGIPDSAEFQNELVALAAQNLVRGYILMCGETPVSFSLCLAAGETLTLDKTGFDPRYAHLNPGTVLAYLTLQRLFDERGFRIYDFGSGDFGYKEFLATNACLCGDLMYLRRTWRNLALVLIHHSLNLVSETLKTMLDQFGWKDRVKKLIHGLR